MKRVIPFTEQIVPVHPVRPAVGSIPVGGVELSLTVISVIVVMTDRGKGRSALSI